MSTWPTGDVYVDFLEDELMLLEVSEPTGDSDKLTPFWFTAAELETVALERRFVLGMVDGPRLKSACFEVLTIELAIQYRVSRESRRRMVKDLAQIWQLVRELNVLFTDKTGRATLKAPAIPGPYQYDYTSVLGFVTVSLAIELEYQVR